jgi:hypothetical protein
MLGCNAPGHQYTDCQLRKNSDNQTAGNNARTWASIVQRGVPETVIVGTHQDTPNDHYNQDEEQIIPHDNEVEQQNQKGELMDNEVECITTREEYHQV